MLFGLFFERILVGLVAAVIMEVERLAGFIKKCLLLAVILLAGLLLLCMLAPFVVVFYSPVVLGVSLAILLQPKDAAPASSKPAPLA